MKILVIDRDTLSAQLIRSKLEAMGHTVIEEPAKNTAIERMAQERFDAVFFDPAPLNHARPVVLGIRRTVQHYPYITLMSQDMSLDDAIKSGANDLIAKPMDATRLETTIKSASRLTRLIERIGDESFDFPSAGGIISKSAFNQLFLSALDRADRYGERSYLVFIGIKNYREILELDGRYAAEYASAKLAQNLVRLRRQSDIIAQTDKAEFCLMLQRPQYETEPMEAANRFGDALGRLEDICAGDTVKVQLYVHLIELPLGALHIEHNLCYENNRLSETAG